MIWLAQTHTHRRKHVHTRKHTHTHSHLTETSEKVLNVFIQSEGLLGAGTFPGSLLKLTMSNGDFYQHIKLTDEALTSTDRLGLI